MNRKLDVEISLHNVREIQVEHCVGMSGRKWLTLIFVDETGAKNEMAVWPPSTQVVPPVFVVEDEVTVRRVETIKELEDD